MIKSNDNYKFKRELLFFFISIVLHMAFFFSIPLSKKIINLSIPGTFDAHLVTNDNFSPVSFSQPKLKQLLSEPKKSHNKSKTINQNKTKLFSNKFTYLQKPGSDSNQKQKLYDSLAIILHQMIIDRITYPDLNVKEKPETITIQFELNPNGDIQQVQLTKPSQYSSFNNSAILAVKSIAPITIAKKYIKQTERFIVNIIFE